MTLRKNNISDNDVTLDNWKPREKQATLVCSQWRQDQIGDDFNQQPSIDDLHKIQMHLKKKIPDLDIMKAFGINAQTLVAIKKEKYDPVDGISLDNQSKIYKEFQLLKEQIDGLFNGLNFIADMVCNYRDEKVKFRHSMKTKTETKLFKKKRKTEDLEIEGDEEE